jgi:hypothetical protein
MHKKSTNNIALIFLTFAFSIACTQAVIASTTGPVSSDKGTGSKVEAARDQGAVVQAITPGPVPADLIVIGGGLEWVYASPCEEGGCSDPSPTNQVGWRYATYEELTQQFPTCEAFIRQDESIICASQYFDPSFSHCDIENCQSGLVCSAPGQLCANGELGPGHGETFYVRGEAGPAIPVPVLSILGVAILVLGLVLLARRRVMI